MPISGPSSYDPTMQEVSAHWQQCNEALPVPAPLVIRLPDNSTVTRATFLALHTGLLAEQSTLQDFRLDLALVRGSLHLKKVDLLERFHQFTTALEAFWQNTKFIMARPLAPGITFGKEAFTDPLGDAMKLWAKMNAGAAPAGLTLPLTLKGGYTQGAFASDISALAFDYAEEKDTHQDVILARGERTLSENHIYEIIKAYREVVPKRLEEFPALVATLPRLTPLPGHTPERVNASAVYAAPDQSKVVHDASTEPTLERYELRGCAGDDWNEEDAVVIASHAPDAPREFVTDFALNQPGAQAVFKLYVILTTGNEAGSAAMAVQRPLAQAA